MWKICLSGTNVPVEGCESMTDEQVQEQYNYLVECDHLKNEYADANKIKLYRIKYTDIKNIDNILQALLQ